MKFPKLVIFCAVMGLLGVLPATAAPVISVLPHETTVGLGDYFTVDIVITDVRELYAVDLDVLFNTDIMDYDSYSQGTFLSSEGDWTFVIPPVILESSGLLQSYVESILSSPDGVSGGGLLFSVTFQATEIGTGLIDIGGELMDINCMPFEYATVAGIVTVVPEPASMVMLGSLGAGLLIMRRRRKKV